jgi:hypothetical protein
MNIVINAELKAYIDPLTAEEHEALERSILADGCRDALVLWGDTLVDGHNRYGICQQHGLPFQTVQNPRFESIEDVYLWMIDQHLGRRSVSNFQRGVLALRKSEIVAERYALALSASQAAPVAADGPGAAAAAPSNAVAAPPLERLPSREAIAKAARLSSSQMVMIEKIRKQAVPEVQAAVRSGDISINVAAVLATLPAETQAVAAAAGTDELKQAAKRVRQAQRKPPERSAAAEPVQAQDDEPVSDSLAGLRQRVAELTAENAALRSQLAALQAAL